MTNAPEGPPSHNVIMGVVVASLVVVLVGAAYFFGRSATTDQRVSSLADRPSRSTTTATPATPEGTTTIDPSTTLPPMAPGVVVPGSTTSTTATTAPAPAPTSTTLPSLPAGLLCRDLRAKGLSYADAVSYWQLNGRSRVMDIDGNGIPCETVYPRAEVTGQSPGSAPTTFPHSATLLCRDLVARGYSYVASVAYWSSDGRPPRMDVDRNGKPCETAYPAAEVTAYWQSGH